MTYPTVHLNGTSKADLIADLCVQMSALRSAIDKMENHGPNGRDYYPQGPAAHVMAMNEHIARMDRVREVIKELNGIAEQIVSQP